MFEFKVEDYSVKELTRMFDYINKKAFNNKLPKISIKAIKNKKYMGLFTYKVRNDGDSYWDLILVSIGISTTWAYEKERVFATMAHEMVHYALILEVLGDLPADEKISKKEITPYMGHGKLFKDLAAKISTTLNITITVTGKMSKTLRTKTKLPALIVDFPGKKVMAVVLTHQFMKAMLADVKFGGPFISKLMPAIISRKATRLFLTYSDLPGLVPLTASRNPNKKSNLFLIDAPNEKFDIEQDLTGILNTVKAMTGG